MSTSWSISPVIYACLFQDNNQSNLRLSLTRKHLIEENLSINYSARRAVAAIFCIHLPNTLNLVYMYKLGGCTDNPRHHNGNSIYMYSQQESSVIFSNVISCENSIGVHQTLSRDVSELNAISVWSCSLDRALALS